MRSKISLDCATARRRIDRRQMARRTKITRIYHRGVVGLLVLISSFGISGRAMADCAKFPQYALWDELTHEFVRQHIDERYGGDWGAYIANLERYRRDLKNIYDKDLRAAVTWRDKKVRLKGVKLADFLELVDQRLSITHCLADDRVLAYSATAPGETDGGDRMGSEESKRCGPIPQVAWWTFKTHEGISRYIARKYQGEWGPYIDKWSRRLEKMTDIYVRGSSVNIPSGIALKDEELLAYISQLQIRNSVVRCLAPNGL